MRRSVVHFFDRNEVWLSAVLAQGHEDGELTFTGSPREKAHLIMSCLEGAMLTARLYGDLDMFQTTATQLLAGGVPASADEGIHNSAR